MEEVVHQAIRARDLLSPGDRIVVAVSGGPDSVALLACLVALAPRWNWELSIGHVNHGLRGAESEEYAAFVERLGKYFGVPVSIQEVWLKKQDAKFTKQSFQVYAREARYQALESILQERCATKIATDCAALVITSVRSDARGNRVSDAGRGMGWNRVRVRGLAEEPTR